VVICSRKGLIIFLAEQVMRPGDIVEGRTFNADTQRNAEALLLSHAASSSTLSSLTTAFRVRTTMPPRLSTLELEGSSLGVLGMVALESGLRAQVS
jgi:hypothetical protein